MEFLKQNTLLFLNIVAGFASIVSVLFLVFTDKTNALIALVFFCVFLLIALFSILRTLRLFIRKENGEDHKKVSVFTTFETHDSTHCVFETYRVIQSKRFILTEISQNFKWSGTKQPVISSSLQKIKVVNKRESDYDQAVLVLKHPLVFNETATIHFKAEMDDYDGKALPYLDYRVETPINIIHYRVILRHKSEDFCKPAKILRRPIFSNQPKDYEEIGSVPFDQKSRSYQYNLINPEVGYYYRLAWEK